MRGGGEGIYRQEERERESEIKKASEIKREKLG